MVKQFIIILLITASVSANAHCPSHFKPENVCFMLDQNIIYIYDSKGEHNGPYQDLKEKTGIDFHLPADVGYLHGRRPNLDTK